MNRRSCLRSLAALLTVSPSTFGQSPGPEAQDLSNLSQAFLPLRPITRGPQHHWFAYYDKLQFDSTNRFVLSNQVSSEHRAPSEHDQIRTGMVDLQDGDHWIELGKSDAWGWQQGCMLQWRPGSPSQVIWNDRESGQFISRIKDVHSGETHTLPRPIYALSPDGRWAVTADFSRIQNLRPGYGYQGQPETHRENRSPQASGIWRLDMDSGESKLIISLAQLAAIPFQGSTLEDQWNWVNHLLVSPDSRRFIFLHRWRTKGPDDPTFAVNNGFVTRMFTANLDGSDLHILDPSGFTSHFIWRDAQHVCAWTKPEAKPAAFYLFRDQSDHLEVVGEGIMTLNGHNTYLPIGDGRDWILNDTYPQGPLRQQIPYLFHVPTGKRHDLGRFHLPKEYQGEWRCDTHPRSSNDGRLVTIDSPHGGSGRQVWLLDISEITG